MEFCNFQAMQVGLMTKNYKWIITNLDAHNIDLEPFQYSGTEITTLRILNRNHSVFNIISPNNENMNELDNEQETNNDFYSGSCAAVNDQLTSVVPIYPDKFNGNFNQPRIFKCFRFIKNLPPNEPNYFPSTDSLSLSLALMYDAVMVFATAIQQLGSDQVLPTSIRCNEPNSVWNKGYTILNFMKTVIFSIHNKKNCPICIKRGDFSLSNHFNFQNPSHSRSNTRASPAELN